MTTWGEWGRCRILMQTDLHGQNQYFLDMKPVNYDICSFVRVGIPSTYLESGDFSCILNISVAQNEHSFSVWPSGTPLLDRLYFR